MSYNRNHFVKKGLPTNIVYSAEINRFPELNCILFLG